MIKKFNVTVNGNQYQVEVEEIKDDVVSAPRPAASAPTVAAAAPQAAPTPAAAPVPAAQAAPAVGSATAGAGESALTAPMPGTILNVAVKVGDSVKAGQLAVVLEAMKMENELPCPADGVVKAVNVNQGNSVNTGDVLVVVG